MPQLLSNASATGAAAQWGGGRGVFSLAGTVNGATVTLQYLGPDESTWLTAATSLTAVGIVSFELPQAKSERLLQAGRRLVCTQTRINPRARDGIRSIDLQSGARQGWSVEDNRTVRRHAAGSHAKCNLRCEARCRIGRKPVDIRNQARKHPGVIHRPHLRVGACFPATERLSSNGGGWRGLHVL